MNHDAPDPYARRRALWPRMRWFMRSVIWTYQAMSAAGLLSSRNPASRWLARRISMLEHGLRCLLIIGAQGMRAATPPRPSPSREGSSDRERRDAEEFSLVGRVRVRRFSLTLKAFNPPNNMSSRPDAGEPGPTSQSASQMDDGAPVLPAAPSNRDDMEWDLVDRLNTLIDIFDAPEPHIARMARRLARDGIKLRRRPTVRPSGAARPVWSDALTIAPMRRIAFADTS